ncbi:MAG TPA: S8 family serine peptidase [Micromonosporaceae bacterium]|jgi:hypothetical protein
MAQAGGPPDPFGAPAPAPPGGPPPTAVGTLEPPPPPRGAPPTAGSGAGAIVAAILIGGWAVAVAGLGQTAGWLIEQVLLIAGLPRQGWLWPVGSVVGSTLIAVPAGLLTAIPRSPAIRAAGRAWFLGALALGVLGLVRAIPIAQSEPYLGTLTLVAVVGGVVLRRFTALRFEGSAQPSARLLAIAAGLAALLPWLALAGLGGALETALAVTAAAAVGGLAGEILNVDFWAPYAEPRRPSGRPSAVRLVLVGGLVAGVALVLLAAGVGPAGVQLAELIVLPPTALAAAALQRVAGPTGRGGTFLSPGAGRSNVAVRWLVALAALGPLAFTDPEEITLVLLAHDVPYWAAIAALGSFAAVLVVGVAYAVAFGRTLGVRIATPLAAGLALVLGLAGVAVYLGPGHPGLHGERLFVVLRDQADLGAIPATTGAGGRADRVRAVYRMLVAHAERSQAPLRHELDRLHLRYTPYYLVNAIEVHAGPELRPWLARRADVDRILYSQRLRPLPAAPSVMHGDQPAPDRPQWNVNMIEADRVWSELGVDGSGVVVGSSDSGIDGTHPALRDGFRGGSDSWYDPWNATRTPTDGGGHGTHTLAIAVGRGGVGVAPGAQWVGCVNLGRNLGNPAHYLDCLQYMLAPFPAGGDPFADGRPERAPHVLTNSWGCPTTEGCDAGVLRPAIAALRAAGIFFVAAAGNTGPFCGSIDDPPAPYADTFTVGAVDRRGRVTDFSSRGPAPGAAKPDLVAPGAHVLSALPGGGYGELDGTSMATPHVAGVVALMWSANPDLIGDVDATARILRETARAAQPSQNGDTCGAEANVAGAGIVDAYAAVRAAKARG